MISVQCSVIRGGKDGQAMTEFMIGLVAVLALLAALVQITEMTGKHTKAMVEARKIAGELAMQGVFPASSPDYMKDWEAGNDGKRYTKDDEALDDNPAPFNDYIVERAAQGANGWDILNGADHDDIPELRNSLAPAGQFGLISGHAEYTVPLLPVFKHLIYDADAIDVECTTWTTWTTGIY